MTSSNFKSQDSHSHCKNNKAEEREVEDVSCIVIQNHRFAEKERNKLIDKERSQLTDKKFEIIDKNEELPMRASQDSLDTTPTLDENASDKRSRGSYDRDKISQQEWEDKVSRRSATPSRSSRQSNVSSTSAKSRDSRKTEIIRKSVSNYTDYKEFLKNYDTTKSLYIFYTGTNSPNSGYSWCSDCGKALSIIQSSLKHIHSSIFLIVYVGLQDEWADKQNPYRLDKHLKLKVLPTLWKFRTPRKLEGKYCMKPELLELIFENDSDYY